MINVSDTLLEQYASSPTIVGMINSMNLAIDPSVDIQNFYTNIWNIKTAVGYGLDVWGNIVGVGRILKIPSTGQVFGFSQQNPVTKYVVDASGNQVVQNGNTVALTIAPNLTSNQAVQPFDQAPFYTISSTQNFTLADSAFRTLILTKAMANITTLTAPNINQLLQFLFYGRGRCYVNDLGNMQMKYTFEFALLPYEYAILTQSNAVPRPAGVKTYITYVPAGTFGFSEALPNANTFDNGTFYTGM